MSSGTKLAWNCLPVSIMCLDLYKPHAPNAFVAIGMMDRRGFPKNHSPIRNFLYLPYLAAPSYHAWIDFGNGDFADLTLSHTYDNDPRMSNFQNIDFSAADAQALNLEYEVVIKDPAEVSKFLKCIRSGTI
jgi:hypothetical protein